VGARWGPVRPGGGPVGPGGGPVGPGEARWGPGRGPVGPGGSPVGARWGPGGAEPRSVSGSSTSQLQSQETLRGNIDLMKHGPVVRREADGYCDLQTAQAPPPFRLLPPPLFI